MDSERLRKLKQQKEVILEHLEWINQEIDQETIASAPRSSPKTSRLREAIAADKDVSPNLEIESSPQVQVASDLYDELGPDTKNAASDTKRGCLIIGGFAFASLAALCIWIAFFY